MIKLNVKEKGHILHIPGNAPFRTPAKVDITHMNLSMVITILNNNGITDFEITSTDGDEKRVYTKKDFEIGKEPPKQDLSKIDERFNKIEKMLYDLAKKKSKKSDPQEQITNKLNALEELSKRILERERVKEIVYTSKYDGDSKKPIIEELDEDTFVPEVDISKMELKGSSSEKIGEIEGAEEAADMLSRLK